MGHDFEDRREAAVPATPAQVWEAIASGPGIDSWFMGRNEVVPGEGGVVRTEFGGYTPVHTVTAWDPGRRLAYRSDEGEDDGFVAYEFLIEGRGGGSTVVRVVTSGFLPGDDWEDEYEAMTLGGDLFFATLVEHLTGFAGRTARPVTAFGPPVTDWEPVWRRVGRQLGTGWPARTGDPVRGGPDGLPPIDGRVYFVNAHTLGVRTEDALYRVLRGFHGALVVGHHLYDRGADLDAAERGWTAWLEEVSREPGTPADRTP